MIKSISHLCFQDVLTEHEVHLQTGNNCAQEMSTTVMARDCCDSSQALWWRGQSDVKDG